MLFLIEVIKGLLTFAAVCEGLGIMYLVFIIASEVGWVVKQENRRKYRTKQKQCGFCGPAGKYIAVIAPGGCFEHGLYIRVSGAYLQIYDGEYPGFIDNIEINFCPKCGRMLREVENNADGGI